MSASITAKPPAPYLGGKRNLARRLCAMIAATPHRAYIEPCVGMGGVFLRRPTPAPVEIINDASGDVANLFRVIRRHYEPFVDELRWLIAGRAEFDRQRGLDPRLLTDIERAVRFLYLQRLAFGGKVAGRTFGVRRDQDSRFNLAQLRAELKALRDRLATVTIEQLDIADVIRRYDSPRALFFIDPPYHLTEGYGLDFGEERYTALADQLAGIAGQFILSINDTPFIRRTFARFRVDEVATTWTVASAAAHRSTKVTELIFRSPPR
ncbi:DNA adenine methylase [Sphingomonas endophytica]|uniref:site-specific DNA-methyltransferase (adenine-specific) n=1 Tax=Sphingomonas endophytica TaxID=869719 RepID=A0ABR6N9S8_9SPHN|nr:DNA adenine methylase [Sphingomonas endophytica]MBB5727538.1 DNA adenine methylase [Sphingomonas endophytica]